MSLPFCQHLSDEQATARLGAALVMALGHSRLPEPSRFFITLSGDLGVGKTTLVRAFLRCLGVDGTVRSPTYTLVESYETTLGAVHHLDWYRLADAAEVEALGFQELRESGVVLVEWPGQAAALAADADLAIRLDAAGEGRRASIEGLTSAGQSVVVHLRNNPQDTDVTSSFS